MKRSGKEQDGRLEEQENRVDLGHGDGASSQDLGHEAGMRNGDDPGPHPDRRFLLE